MAKRFRPDDEEHETELNLVPYMDIMLNLIMFMLFSTTSLTQMGVIQISLPQYGDGPTDVTDEDPKEAVEITLAISNLGFSVMANGVEVDGKVDEPTIPRGGVGRLWDYEALGAKMEAIKAIYPEEETLVIVASEDIEFEVIVSSMDAAREVILESVEGEGGAPGNRHLFPDVVLSVM